MTRVSASRAMSGGLAFGLAASGLAGCMPSPGIRDPVPPIAAAQTDIVRSAPFDRTVELADLLARAEAAYEADDRAALASILTALNTSAPRPLQAGEDDRIETWADAARVELAPMRGRVLGPGYMRGRLKSGETWTHEQNFLAGEPASLAVSMRGSGPLELRVSNSRRAPVCAIRANAGKACRFTPIYTQRYRIELSNEGAEDAIYYVVID